MESRFPFGDGELGCQVGSGGPEALVPAELPDPVPGPVQVVVRVAAAGVNRADALVRAGVYHRTGRPPLIPGIEAAGTVAALGEGVTGLSVGQPVMAMGPATGSGFSAELGVTAAERVTPLPDGLGPVGAAALPSAWFTARYCLRRPARVTEDGTVVVHAVASGVGSAAVQIAAEAGARVIALATIRAPIRGSSPSGRPRASSGCRSSRFFHRNGPPTPIGSWHSAVIEARSY